ncbi:MAG TPA: YdeI/OmpD-associated family protein [Flavilitoribacter sp.]|nr:YdeI/OmpD-associated family protein [Flavilitoribacter sp.]HMQ90454.1 YdeI/OmpD-associated family protein [Flavilitoribacter sp.]
MDPVFFPTQADFREKDHKSEIYSFEQGQLELPDACEKELKATAKAWSFFQSLPPSAKKQTIWWVISAKQETTRQKRLGVLIECSEQGLRIPELRRAKK